MFYECYIQQNTNLFNMQILYSKRFLNINILNRSNALAVKGFILIIFMLFILNLKLSNYLII